jgi:hypothetical protein
MNENIKNIFDFPYVPITENNKNNLIDQTKILLTWKLRESARSMHTVARL